MGDRCVSVNINVDVNDLLRQIGQAIGGSRDNYQEQRVNGGRWISTMQNGKVYSMYFHPSKRHSATAKGTTQARSIAGPGQWAVAWAAKAPWGNKTFWNDAV
jgi:lactococcin 972 family bacteriocin